MRNASTELSASESLCDLWRIAPRDGAVIGFTDHDHDLVVDGATYRASTLTRTDGDLGGALDDLTLDESALSNGVWDGARIDIYRCDWRAVDNRVRVFSGALGSVRREGARFTAALLPRSAALDRSIGRVFSRGCDADLGDVRCGVAPALVPLGCDKSFATCRVRFDNAANFRGFPHMPGTEAALGGPGDDPRDGGSRWR